MAKKYCYLFSEGNANMRELLGGKGANLAEMTNIGLPVPQGFTITTEACTQYYEDGREINPEIMAEINEYIVKMEGITGKKFGDKKNPLLVSVRSGARASMPGMMDTILNLGLNEEVVNTISEMSGNPRWAWDCYRRFIQMYSDVVMEVGKKYFEQLIDAMKKEKGVTQDVELDADDLKKLAMQFKDEYKAKIGEDFPSDPKDQLMALSRLFSVHGTTPVQTFIAVITTSRIHGVPQLTYSQWHSATWAMIAAQALHSHVTRLPALRASSVSSLQTLRARTLLQAFVLPCTSQRWSRSSPRHLQSLKMFARPLRIITEICRIWSSPLSTASFICFRPETVREQLRQLFRLLATSLTRV